MRTHHEIYFLILAFLSELIGAASGVSSSTLFIPMARLLESFQVTLALTAALHILGNLYRAIAYRKEINWSLTFKFGVPAILCTGFAAQYSDILSEQTYSILLGLFLVSISTYLLFFNSRKIFDGVWMPYLGGALSGLLTGFLGSGGAVRSMALTGFALTPAAFIATSTLIDFGGDILRFIVYIKKGYLNSEHYFYIPILAIVVFIANAIAKRWVQKIPKDKFKKIVLVFVLVIGLFSIVTGILNFAASPG